MCTTSRLRQTISWLYQHHLGSHVQQWFERSTGYPVHSPTRLVSLNSVPTADIDRSWINSSLSGGFGSLFRRFWQGHAVIGTMEFRQLPRPIRTNTVSATTVVVVAVALTSKTFPANVQPLPRTDAANAAVPASGLRYHETATVGGPALANDQIAP